MAVHRPDSCEALAALIGEASRDGAKLEVRGGGSKAGLGATRDAELVDMRSFSGITAYDPAELVLTVGAGTSLAEIEEALARERQMLAFAPFDQAKLLDITPGATTIGGIVAAAVAGPARLSRGGARDHVLGFTAVSGRGERFVGGGKVVKNVTGYDMSKLVTGSWGRLAALAEVTLKVLPRARMTSTLALSGLDRHAAQRALAAAMAGPAEVVAAAHFATDGDRPLTLLRLEGFEPSVRARMRALAEQLVPHGRWHTLPDDEAEAKWTAVRDAAPLAGTRSLWRVHLPASSGPALIDRLSPLGARWLLDWAGGLVWIGLNDNDDAVRPAAEALGGHAMLVRAPPALWATMPTQHPRAPAVMQLEATIRQMFDPHGVFETGRFLDMHDAD